MEEDFKWLDRYLKTHYTGFVVNNYDVGCHLYLKDINNFIQNVYIVICCGLHGIRLVEITLHSSLSFFMPNMDHIRSADYPHCDHDRLGDGSGLSLPAGRLCGSAN